MDPTSQLAEYAWSAQIFAGFEDKHEVVVGHRVVL
jgi:hypothetical protein